MCLGIPLDSASGPVSLAPVRMLESGERREPMRELAELKYHGSARCSHSHDEVNAKFLPCCFSRIKVKLWQSLSFLEGYWISSRTGEFCADPARILLNR